MSTTTERITLAADLLELATDDLKVALGAGDPLLALLLVPLVEQLADARRRLQGIADAATPEAC